jgi:hypothetical protein
MGNVNRKATRDEMAHAYRVIREAFPELEPGGPGQRRAKKPEDKGT